jgi:hypothetical protein
MEEITVGETRSAHWKYMEACQGKLLIAPRNAPYCAGRFIAVKYKVHNLRGRRAGGIFLICSPSGPCMARY